MNSSARRSGISHVAFLGVVGLAGWVAVTALSTWHPDFLKPWQVSWDLLAILALCGAARFLAFPVLPQVRIALDSVFYVAAAFVFGVIPAAWLGVTVFTVEALVEKIRQRSDPEPWLLGLVQIFYRGGLAALMLIAVGLLLDVDGQYPRDDLTLAWLLPLFAVVFLVGHYLLAGGTHWLEGAAARVVWRKFFLLVVAAELALVPIALAMVWGYEHQGLAPFFLLGVSAVLFNVIFRRERIATSKLHQRVGELGTLIKVGHSISGSLQRRVLLQNISTETLRLVGQGSRFMVGLISPEGNHVEYELFDETGQRYGQMSAPADDGLSGWVMTNRKPLLLGNVQRDYLSYSKSATYNDSRFFSWMGVPLVTYNEVTGIMSVQTEKRDAYTPDHLRILSAVAEQAAVAFENSRLYELATIDGLTRLLVRRHFDQRLHEEWDRAVRYRTPFAVGIFDLDNFKKLNDTYGHQAGDQVLRAAAAAVRNNMRTADLAGRYGGEEFAFVFPRTTIPEALHVAERIRSDIDALAIHIGGKILRVQASIGLAAYPESKVAKVEELIARADEALYRAKRAGKNRVETALPTSLLTPTHLQPAVG